MTELAHIILRMIAETGPLPIDRFMTLALSHPAHGYYMTRDPFGVDGDFTTGPEISQVFGELVAVWVAQSWRAMGEPREFALVELGPGRGTLMADILRVLEQVKGARKAASVHFIEMSPALRQAQAERVPDATWHVNLASLPGVPSIVIANEFFDALPIRQFANAQGRASETVVAQNNGTLSRQHILSPQRLPSGDGIWEDHAIRSAFATSLGDYLTKASGYALIIDYGHVRSAYGDTLQALYRHKPCLITEHVGDADITSHVDFEALAKGLAQGGMARAGFMTQGEFLNAMGIDQRTAILLKNADSAQAAQISSASKRLVANGEMGQLFKVMAAASKGLSLPYPFGET
jgi:NADH dehydrogenase [ubiquinone] 1 alpha subcomplex assembly factor 7